MRSRRSRSAAPLVLIAALAALAAGCGSTGPSATTGQAAQGGPQNGAAAAFAYSRCMRSHGVANFPDPHVTSSAGHTAISIAVNPSQTGSPNFRSADKACAGILPTPGDIRAQQQARKQNLLAFARCLRANGIHEFPDPDTQGQLPLPKVIAAGVDIHSRTFLDAAKACVGVTHGMITMQQIQAGINGGH